MTADDMLFHGIQEKTDIFAYGGIFMNSGLQVYNEQAKLAQWAQVVSR